MAKEFRVFMLDSELSNCNEDALDNGKHYENRHHLLTVEVEDFIDLCIEYGKVLTLADYMYDANNDNIGVNELIYITNNYQ